MLHLIAVINICQLHCNYILSYNQNMADRGYISNLHPAYTVAAQREVLAGITTLYVDELGPAARRRKDPADLKQRALMLRPTTRREGETIKIMALCCMARTGLDFLAVLAAAAARNATIVALNSGRTIAPSASPAETLAAAQEVDGLWRRTGLGDARKAAAAAKVADTERRLGLIRDDWPKPDSEFTTADLLHRAGSKPKRRGSKWVPMAPITARLALGRRPEVQRAYANRLAQEAGRAAGRARRKGERGDE